MKFKSHIITIQGHKIIRIPEYISMQLPSRGMVMAKISFKEHTQTMPIEPDGYQGHYIRLDHTMNDDELSVSIETVDQWPAPSLPDDMLQVLQSKHLDGLFQQLTTKAQWTWLRWIRSATLEKTRRKRLDTMCDLLEANKKRPCCFDHSRCTETDVSKCGKLIID